MKNKVDIMLEFSKADNREQLASLYVGLKDYFEQHAASVVVSPNIAPAFAQGSTIRPHIRVIFPESAKMEGTDFSDDKLAKRYRNSMTDDGGRGSCLGLALSELIKEIREKRHILQGTGYSYYNRSIPS